MKVDQIVLNIIFSCMFTLLLNIYGCYSQEDINPPGMGGGPPTTVPSGTGRICGRAGIISAKCSSGNTMCGPLFSENEICVRPGTSGIIGCSSCTCIDSTATLECTVNPDAGCATGMNVMVPANKGFAAVAPHTMADIQPVMPNEIRGRFNNEPAQTIMIQDGSVTGTVTSLNGLFNVLGGSNPALQLVFTRLDVTTSDMNPRRECVRNDDLAVAWNREGSQPGFFRAGGVLQAMGSVLLTGCEIVIMPGATGPMTMATGHILNCVIVDKNSYPVMADDTQHLFSVGFNITIPSPPMMEAPMMGEAMP